MYDKRKIFGSNNYKVNIVQVLMQGVGGPPTTLEKEERKKKKGGGKEKENRVMFCVNFLFCRLV